MTQHFAVFDLDETITTRGTWGRFVSMVVKDRPLKLAGLWARAAIAQLIYKVGPQDRMSVKRGMLRRALSGRPRAELEALAEGFAESEIETGLRPGAIRQLEAHRAAGDIIIIASAGADLVVEPIAKRLGVTHVVCTEIGWDGNVCARDFASENCYGPGKLTRLRKCLETFDDYRREAAHVTVYSDSYSDLPILEFADKGVAVNADKTLRKAADIHGLETVDWST